MNYIWIYYRIYLHISPCIRVIPSVVVVIQTLLRCWVWLILHPLYHCRHTIREISTDSLSCSWMSHLSCLYNLIIPPLLNSPRMNQMDAYSQPPTLYSPSHHSSLQEYSDGHCDSKTQLLCWVPFPYDVLSLSDLLWHTYNFSNCLFLHTISSPSLII